MMLTILAACSLVLAAIPAIMFSINLRAFRLPLLENLRATDALPKSLPQVSLLIPARNEAAGIAAAIEAALLCENVVIEIIVLDDQSEDRTAEIVSTLAAQDPRIRLIHSAPLPAGWNGKQHACYQLALASRFRTLAFIDADVRLKPAALEHLISYKHATRVDLLSAFPHQLTGTWLEKWLIPLMHFILLGFLPFGRMRRSHHPAYAAGCGQLFVTGKDAYEKAGTHAAIAGSRHDGLKLPRAYRLADLSTDVIDGTSIADCRMYASAAEVIRGLLKNATEGIANPRLIIPFSVVLVGGTILPWVTLLAALSDQQSTAVGLSLLAIALSHWPRAMAAWQFRQSWQGVLFHAPAVGIFVVLQWLALFNHLRGHQTPWRGRA